MAATPCPGCTVPILAPLPACRSCLGRLPKAMRVPAQTSEAGRLAAHDWLADHPIRRPW